MCVLHARSGAPRSSSPSIMWLTRIMFDYLYRHALNAGDTEKGCCDTEPSLAIAQLALWLTPIIKPGVKLWVLVRVYPQECPEVTAHPENESLRNAKELVDDIIYDRDHGNSAFWVAEIIIGHVTSRVRRKLFCGHWLFPVFFLRRDHVTALFVSSWHSTLDKVKGWLCALEPWARKKKCVQGPKIAWQPLFSHISQPHSWTRENSESLAIKLFSLIAEAFGNSTHGDVTHVGNSREFPSL